MVVLVTSALIAILAHGSAVTLGQLQSLIAVSKTVVESLPEE